MQDPDGSVFECRLFSKAGKDLQARFLFLYDHSYLFDMILSFNSLYVTLLIMKRLVTSVFLLFLLSVLQLLAQPDRVVKNVWTMNQLLDTALKNNPETRAAWWNANRAAAAVGSAKSAFYPELALNVNTYNGRDFKFTNGKDVDYTILEAELVMSFLLADFGERAANFEMAKMAFLAAGWETEWSIQKVMAEVLENGYAVLYAQDALEALQSSLVDARRMLDVAEKLNEAGLTPISDVYSSKAALAQIQIDVVRQLSQLDIQKATLAVTLGFDADTPLTLAPLDALSIPQKQLSELIAIAKYQRQDLLSKRFKLAEVIARQKKIDVLYKPKLFFNAAGGEEHALNDKAVGAHYRVGLTFEAPLFTGFDATYQKRMAFADVKITNAELFKLELDIALEVFIQKSNVEAAKEMLVFAKDNLENAQAAYSGALEKYNAGKERIAEVSIALRQVVNARVSYSEISSSYLIATANLAFATGTLSPYMESRCIKN